MALSSLSVVADANRLKTFRPTAMPEAGPPAGEPVVEVGRTEKDTTRQGGSPMSAATVVDPVCGMTIDPAGAARSIEYDETTYFFCSEHCAASFEADPGKYAGTSA